MTKWSSTPPVAASAAIPNCMQVRIHTKQTAWPCMQGRSGGHRTSMRARLRGPKSRRQARLRGHSRAQSARARLVVLQTLRLRYPAYNLLNKDIFYALSPVLIPFVASSSGLHRTSGHQHCPSPCAGCSLPHQSQHIFSLVLPTQPRLVELGLRSIPVLYSTTDSLIIKETCQCREVMNPNRPMSNRKRLV